MLPTSGIDTAMSVVTILGLTMPYAISRVNEANPPKKHIRNKIRMLKAAESCFREKMPVDNPLRLLSHSGSKPPAFRRRL